MLSTPKSALIDSILRATERSSRNLRYCREKTHQTFAKLDKRDCVCAAFCSSYSFFVGTKTISQHISRRQLTLRSLQSLLHLEDAVFCLLESLITRPVHVVLLLQLSGQRTDFLFEQVDVLKRELQRDFSPFDFSSRDLAQRTAVLSLPCRTNCVTRSRICSSYGSTVCIVSERMRASCSLNALHKHQHECKHS